MHRAILGGFLLALLMIALAAASNLLALNLIWPALLAGALVLAPGRAHAGRVSAFLVGGAAGWVGYLLRVTLLPDLTVTPGLALAAAVLVVTAVAAVTSDRLPLWSAAVGVAAFSGVYEATFRATPTLFASQSLVALTTFVAAGAVGTLAGLGVRVLITADSAAAEDVAVAEEGAR